MSKWTPGPWQWWTSNSLKRLTSHAGGRSGKDGGVLHAYRCTDGVADIAVSEADMALISAAPDLAEALEYILSDVEPTEFALSYVARGKAEAALKKAKGER